MLSSMFVKRLQIPLLAHTRHKLHLPKLFCTMATTKRVLLILAEGKNQSLFKIKLTIATDIC